MIAIPLSHFLTDWITLFQSLWISFERCLNFLKQNIGFCKICLQDWFIFEQSFKETKFRFQKTFSASCWRPKRYQLFITNLFFIFTPHCVQNWFIRFHNKISIIFLRYSYTYMEFINKSTLCLEKIVLKNYMAWMV